MTNETTMLLLKDKRQIAIYPTAKVIDKMLSQDTNGQTVSIFINGKEHDIKSTLDMIRSLIDMQPYSKHLIYPLPYSKTPRAKKKIIYDKINTAFDGLINYEIRGNQCEKYRDETEDSPLYIVSAENDEWKLTFEHN